MFIFHILINIIKDPRYTCNDSVFYQRFCFKIEFAVIKKLDRTRLNMNDRYFKTFFFFFFFFSVTHVLCIC